MEFQHVNVKLLVKNPEEINLELLIPVFHSWIQDQVCEELLLDVADYRHVFAGPGVVLIGHEANYSVDNSDNHLGVRYNRKAVVQGSNQDRFKQATRAALTACQRLESDPRLQGKLRFNGQEMELFINDRLPAANCDATYEAVQPELQAFFRKMCARSPFSLEYNRDPRQLFSVSVKASQPIATADLLDNLSS